MQHIQRNNGQHIARAEASKAKIEKHALRLIRLIAKDGYAQIRVPIKYLGVKYYVLVLREPPEDTSNA